MDGAIHAAATLYRSDLCDIKYKGYLISPFYTLFASTQTCRMGPGDSLDGVMSTLSA